MTLSRRTDLARKDRGRGNFSMLAFFVFFMTFVSMPQWWKFSLIFLLWLTYLSKSFLLPFTFLVIFNSRWALALTQSLHAEAMSLQSACILVPASAVHALLLCLSSVRSFQLRQPHLLPSLLDLLHIEMDFFLFSHFEEIVLEHQSTCLRLLLLWDYHWMYPAYLSPEQAKVCLPELQGPLCHLQTEVRKMCPPTWRSRVSTEGSIQAGPMDQGQLCEVQ